LKGEVKGYKGGEKLLKIEAWTEGERL